MVEPVLTPLLGSQLGIVILAPAMMQFYDLEEYLRQAMLGFICRKATCSWVTDLLDKESKQAL